MTDPAVVYVVVSGGGLESVWTNPDDAIDAKDKIGASAAVTVRPLDSDAPTSESQTALAKLRDLVARRGVS